MSYCIYRCIACGLKFPYLFEVCPKCQRVDTCEDEGVDFGTDEHGWKD